MIKEKWREKVIQNIKDAGQSLIDNAEKIVNDYKYTLNDGIDINIYNISSITESPYIRVDTSFYPEKYIERDK